MKLLAIDCTAAPASVAVVEDGKTLSAAFTNVGLTHSQTLIPMLGQRTEECAAEQGRPGRLCHQRRPRLIYGRPYRRCRSERIHAFERRLHLPGLHAGVHGLQLPWRQRTASSSPPWMPGSVRSTRPRSKSEGVHGHPSEPRRPALRLEELEEQLKNPQKKRSYFVGDGASLCYNEFQTTFPNVHLAPERLRYQNAVSVAACAEQHKAAGEEPVTAEEVLPVYLRAPQAERELKARQKETAQ